MHAHPDGATVTVWVVPGAARRELGGVHGDALKVRVSAPPEGGKANAAVAEVIAEATGAVVTLIRGARSRRKTFLAAGTTTDALVRALVTERRSGRK